MPYLLDADIIPDKLDSYPARSFLIAFIDQVPHDVGQFYHYFRGLIRFLQAKGNRCCQRIKKGNEV